MLVSPKGIYRASAASRAEGASVPRDPKRDKTRALDRERPRPEARARAAADVPIYSCSTIHQNPGYPEPALHKACSRRTPPWGGRVLQGATAEATALWGNFALSGERGREDKQIR